MIIGYSRVSGTTPTDPHFANVVLLMGFEGSNGATGSPGMDDESLSVHGTLSGGSSTSNISTAQFKAGSSSLHLTGNSVDFPDSADWDLGSGHFTIEFFGYPGTVSGVQFLVGQWNAAPDLGWQLYMNGNNLCWNTSTTGSDNNTDITGSTAITSSLWHHLCIDYDGIKYRVYVDGVQNGSFATPRTLFNSSTVLTLGAAANGGFLFDPGFMDELRITKGVARYATDTSFTVPTVPLPRS